MKKINIIIIILLIMPFQLDAQRQQVIEPTNLECWYSLVVIRDTIDRSLKTEDTMVLRIGKSIVSFIVIMDFTMILYEPIR